MQREERIMLKQRQLRERIEASYRIKVAMLEENDRKGLILIPVLIQDASYQQDHNDVEKCCIHQKNLNESSSNSEMYCIDSDIIEDSCFNPKFANERNSTANNNMFIPIHDERVNNASSDDDGKRGSKER